MDHRHDRRTRADGARAVRGQEGHRRPGPPAGTRWWWRCWRAGTCWSRACRGWPRRMAIKTLAAAIGGEFKRIQFTPDLVPADLVGTRIYNQKTGEFNTSLGPGLHQPAAGRRDQPRAGQGAERAAGSDAGAPGHHRARDLQGARPVPGAGDAEPDRDRGHLCSARGPGRPLHAEGAGRLSQRQRGVRDRRAHDGPAAKRCSRCSSHRAAARPAAARPTRSMSTRR